MLAELHPSSLHEQTSVLYSSWTVVQHSLSTVSSTLPQLLITRVSPRTKIGTISHNFYIFLTVGLILLNYSILVQFYVMYDLFIGLANCCKIQSAIFNSNHFQHSVRIHSTLNNNIYCECRKFLVDFSPVLCFKTRVISKLTNKYFLLWSTLLVQLANTKQ